MALRTPDSLITMWLAALRAAGRSPATITQYTEAANCYLAFLGREADTATRLDARRFQQHLLDTRSPGGAALYLRTIKALYGWAVHEELADANPFHGLSIRPPQDAQTTADGDDIEALIQTASRQTDRRRGARDVALVTALATTGCHRGELAAVTVRDVDIFGSAAPGGEQDPHASGAAHRSGHRRALPLDALAGHRGGGNLWGVQHPEQLITKTVRTLSGGRLTPHSLRRAFAVSSLSQGGSESALVRPCGWQDSSMVRVYTRASADLLARGGRRLLDPSRPVRPGMAPGPTVSPLPRAANRRWVHVTAAGLELTAAR